MRGGLRSQTQQGFYEIEDVRKKRVRKGHTEYLIKWRDWPERSNTWEPLENLQEYVEEFEESLLLRKQKRKRKGRVASNSSHKEGNKENETDDEDVGTITTQQTHENESVSSRLCEIRERTSTDNLNSESGKKKVSDITLYDNMLEGHNPEVDFDESTSHSNRLTGAKRRKSGNVKRFQKESTMIDDAQNGDKSEPDQDKEEKLSNYPHYITKIIKATGYSVSIKDGVQDDVRVTFLAVSSDGTEVVVDNKQLKAENPQLLFSFYEQNLRYSFHE
ncbi:hypothetical protein MKW98_016687 [Papaver atlanticum]|uniref:Chromo domain-containing protein n=1 Tax=Papaver atlanticum TaxID=357466 RepID=A0AAD4SR03_9MAGN|nr:hypothetical protein MKW98_016687 [Papaver atlanticum]